jgi:hypothetical protein
LPRRLLLLLALPAALCAPGCGGDDEEGEARPPRTELTAPRTSTPGPTETGPAEEGTPTTPPEGGPGETTPPDRDLQRDEPGNDVPPPPGSPAERFERECERNPALCE